LENSNKEMQMNIDEEKIDNENLKNLEITESNSIYIYIFCNFFRKSSSSKYCK
jgi:hypothetical protein